MDKTFVEGAGDIVTTLEEQKAKLAPTFAFVDPFGISGVPMKLFSRLLPFDKCEVFFNFMYDSINRWAVAGNVDEHLRELFDTDAFKLVKGLGPEERQKYLHELYHTQLKAECNFTYVQHLSMYRKDGHLVYSLFFGTRNIAGLRVMKDAMWKVDPGGGNKFYDRFAGQPVLFEPEPNLTPLRNDLRRHFAGRTVSVEEIEEYTLVNTPYKASHWNRSVMAPLEKEQFVTVVASPRKKRFTFPPGTVVTFSA